MAAEEFLRGLPVVTANELPTDKACSICLRQYGAADSGGEPPEAALRLPCGHIIGSQCIATWVSSTGEGKNTCPFCRHIFFDLDDDLDDDLPSGPTRADAILRYLVWHGHFDHYQPENVRDPVATVNDSYAVPGRQHYPDTTRPRGADAQGTSPTMPLGASMPSLPPTSSMPSMPSMPSRSATPSLPSMPPRRPDTPGITGRPTGSVYQPIRGTFQSNFRGYGPPRPSDLPGTRDYFRNPTATSSPPHPTWMPPNPPHTSFRPVDRTSGYTPPPSELPGSREYFRNPTVTSRPPRSTWMPPNPPHTSFRPVDRTSGYTPPPSDLPDSREYFHSPTVTSRPPRPTWMPPSPPHTSLRPVDRTSDYTPHPSDQPGSREYFHNPTATSRPPHPGWMPHSPAYAPFRLGHSTSGYMNTTGAGRGGNASGATLPAFSPSHSTWMPQNPPPFWRTPVESGYWSALSANRAGHASTGTMGSGTPSGGALGRGAGSRATLQGDMSTPTFPRLQ